MTKYHVRPDGSLGVCNAQHNCRYNMHVDADTPENAQRKVDDYNQALASADFGALTLAENGIGLDIMANSKDWHERNLAASYCNGDDAILDKLVHDTDERVTYQVIRYHRPQDAEVLMNDDFDLTRVECAKFGGDNVLDHLVNDKHFYVRDEVVKRGRDVDLDILKKDRVSQVRAAVADFGRPQDKERFLTKERVPYVRQSYVEHCDLNDVRDFLNDPSETVREAALKRINDGH